MYHCGVYSCLPLVSKLDEDLAARLREVEEEKGRVGRVKEEMAAAKLQRGEAERETGRVMRLMKDQESSLAKR